MRLIDADALIDKYQSEFSIDVFRYEILEDLNEAPTVDAVPVIRCKDCIRWRRSKSDITAKVCDWDGYERTESDYCSWAKRIEHD